MIDKLFSSPPQERDAPLLAFYQFITFDDALISHFYKLSLDKGRFM